MLALVRYCCNPFSHMPTYQHFPRQSHGTAWPLEDAAGMRLATVKLVHRCFERAAAHALARQLILSCVLPGRISTGLIDNFLLDITERANDF